MKKFGLFLVMLACVSFFAAGCEEPKKTPTTPAKPAAGTPEKPTTPAPSTPAPEKK